MTEIQGRNAYYIKRLLEEGIGREAKHDHVTNFTVKNHAGVEFHHLVSGQRAMFKAFITTFNDDHTSEWSEESLYGRMDNTSTFKRTVRKITLEFDVPSFSQQEAVSNLKEMSKLKQFLYPAYARAGVNYQTSTYARITSVAGNSLAISSSPIMRVRFLNYISSNSPIDSDRGLLCSIANIAFSPNQDAGEYVLQANGEKEATIIVPKLFKINLSLSIFHEHTLGWVEKNGTYQFGDDDKISDEYPYKANRVKLPSPLDVPRNAAAASPNGSTAFAADTTAAARVTEKGP